MGRTIRVGDDVSASRSDAPIPADGGGAPLISVETVKQVRGFVVHALFRDADESGMFLEASSEDVLVASMRHLGYSDAVAETFAARYGEDYFEVEQDGAGLDVLAGWVADRSVEPVEVEVCGSRGPRIGSDGTPRCGRPVGHQPPCRPDRGDGWPQSLSW